MAGVWKLTGVKRFITNGGSDVHLILARSEEGSSGAKGLSLFLYRKDNTLTIRRIEDKMGLHGSPTTENYYNNSPCELIGERKYGLVKYVMRLINSARLVIAAQALGTAQAAYDKALKYAKERIQFNKPIIEFSAVNQILTNDLLDLELSRSLIYRTAILFDELELLEDKYFGQGPYTERIKKLKRITSALIPLSK
ncbi:MAG: acyl-CoA dehydrogenase family protein [Ignavibacteria bacterium]|nr:acyl-CoA dehydrogenase family protein [Ignavibacteria bacterium]